MAELFLKDIPLGPVKSVLFDKDGTISNSEQHLFDLAELRIKESKKLFFKEGKTIHEVRSLEKLLKSAYGLTFKGINPNGIIAIASNKTNLLATATVFSLIGNDWPKAIDLAKKVFEKIDNEEKKSLLSTNKRTVLPGVRNFLTSLNKEGVTCAIISNDTKSGINQFLKKNNLEKFFKATWSAEHKPSKPDPEAIKGLCQILKVKPIECALIGDADTDLLMARKAGVQICLGYLSGWSRPPVLTEHHKLIKHWGDLSVNENLK